MIELSKDTIEILKNFNNFNSTMRIVQGNTLSIMPQTGGDFLARATVKEMFDKEIGLRDIPRFLGVLSVLSNPKIELDEHHITILGEKGEVVNFTNAAAAMLRHIAIDPKTSKDVEFFLSAETLSSVVKTATILQLGHIAFEGENGEIFIRAVKKDDRHFDSVSIKVGETDKKFSFFVKVEFLKILPRDYNVSIDLEGQLAFEGDNVKYWMTVETE